MKDICMLFLTQVLMVVLLAAAPAAYADDANDSFRDPAGQNTDLLTPPQWDQPIAEPQAESEDKDIPAKVYENPGHSKEK